jgi:putative peptidoglycan lipid II flippase
MNWGLKLGIIISLPSCIGLILLAEPILITLLQYREFSINDVHMTALSLMAFALGLPGMIGAKILITNYYSRKNTKYPVKAALIAVLFNFILNIALVLYLINIDFKGVHVGLALATSISSYINFYYLFKNALKTKILIIDKGVINILLKSILASIIMTILIFNFDLDVNSWVNLNLLERIRNLFFIVSSSLIIYFAMLYILKISPKT